MVSDGSYKPSNDSKESQDLGMYLNNVVPEDQDETEEQDEQDEQEEEDVREEQKIKKSSLKVIPSKGKQVQSEDPVGTSSIEKETSGNQLLLERENTGILHVQTVSELEKEEK